MTVEEQAGNLSRDEIVSLLVTEKSLNKTNAALNEEVSTLKEKLSEAEHQLSWFKRQLFGEKSERRVALEDPRQLYLGGGLEGEKKSAPAKVEVKQYERGKAKKNPLEGSPEDSGLRFGPEVPVEIIPVPNPELEGLSKDEYEEITEKYTYRLAQRPGSYVVLKYVRKVVKHKEKQKLLCPVAPPAVIERSVADVSFLVGMLIDKFLYHIPLYRQHQRLKDSGIVLSRATLTHLTHRGISLLVPLYEAQFRSVLDSLLLCMDEIPLKTGRESKGKMNKAYFWPIYGDKTEIVFPWRESRAYNHVLELLRDFSGILLSDGYEAYKQYVAKTEGAYQAQCWNHSRRNFVDSIEVEPLLANEALDFIGKLYLAEKQIQKLGLKEEKKLLYRVEHSKPVVEEFFKWLEDQLIEHTLLPKNPFTKAANYVLDREEELKLFLRFPEVQIDTNHEERELRSIAMGRRNWLFCWTEIGAHYVGVIQSLLRTCILQKVNPTHYLLDVFQRIRTHPPEDIHLLTPRLWKEHFKDCRMKAPLELVTLPDG